MAQKLNAEAVKAIAQAMQFTGTLMGQPGEVRSGQILERYIVEGRLNDNSEDAVTSALRIKLQAAESKIRVLEAELAETQADNAKEQSVIAAAIMAFGPDLRLSVREHGQRRGRLVEAVEALLDDGEDEDEECCTTTLPEGRYGVFRTNTFGHEARSSDDETRGTFLSYAAARDAADEHSKEVGIEYHVRELRADEN